MEAGRDVRPGALKPKIGADDMATIESEAPRHEAELLPSEQAPMPEYPNGTERNPNGCSCGGVHPTDKPKPKKNWLQTATDWRLVLATLLAPAACALIYYLMPPTKSDLSAVKIEAASNLDIVKTDISGQIKATHVEIDAIKWDISNLRGDVREVGRDIKEMLRRSDVSPRQAEVVSEPAPVKATPAVPPPSPHRAKKIEKKVEKKDAGLVGWITR